MKCPYICNGETIHHVKPVIYQKIEVENADCTSDVLHCTANDYVDTSVNWFHDCLKEECAAYQNGHCIRSS